MCVHVHVWCIRSLAIHTYMCWCICTYSKCRYSCVLQVERAISACVCVSHGVSCCVLWSCCPCLETYNQYIPGRMPQAASPLLLTGSDTPGYVPQSWAMLTWLCRTEPGLTSADSDWDEWMLIWSFKVSFEKGLEALFRYRICQVSTLGGQPSHWLARTYVHTYVHTCIHTTYVQMYAHMYIPTFVTK